MWILKFSQLFDPIYNPMILWITPMTTVFGKNCRKELLTFTSSLGRIRFENPHYV